MLRKTIALSFVLLLVFLLSGTCLASEKPLGEITSTQQIIDKLFVGRTLDPIEGIWVLEPGYVEAIVKTSLVNIKDPDAKSYDYVSIILTGKYSGNIVALFRKTAYNFCFYEQYRRSHWKLVTPTLLLYDGKFGSNCPAAESYVRIYPTTQP